MQSGDYRVQKGFNQTVRAGRALTGWKSIQPYADGRTLYPIRQLVGAKPFILSTYCVYCWSKH